MGEVKKQFPRPYRRGNGKEYKQFPGTQNYLKKLLGRLGPEH